MPIFEDFYVEETCSEVAEATSDMIQQRTDLFFELSEGNFDKAIKDVESLSEEEGAPI